MSDPNTKHPQESLPPNYFDELYRENPDPWQFETSPYEAAKYAATLAALPRARYAGAFEIGCSIGVLTEQLAGRCDALLAVDVSEVALDRAQERCRCLPQVRFARMRVPAEFPAEGFDLILLSEVGSYWTPEDLVRALDLMVAHLVPGGHLLLVHWTPFTADLVTPGDEVHDIVLRHAGTRLRHLLGQRASTYRLDLFERA